MAPASTPTRQLMPPRRRQTAPRALAFTLVELLVALVILMIGIYAMLRIFPSGFSAIELSQQRTTAAQLAEAELARWRLHPESLPDAIVATDYEGNLVNATLVNNSESLQSILVYGELAADIPGSTNYQALTLPRGEVQIANIDIYARPFVYDPLDKTHSQFDAALAVWTDTDNPRPNTLHPNWQPNSLYLPRTVKGERVEVRGLGLTREGVPFHLLSHAPLDVLRYEENPLIPGERLPVYVDVYDADTWEYRPDLGPADLGERQFDFDPATGVLSFGPSDAPSGQIRDFKVDYTDPITNLRVIGATVRVSPGAITGEPALPSSTQYPLDATTLQVNQRLRALTYSQWQTYMSGDWLAWPRDTYYVDTESTITGEIQFSPALQLIPLEEDVKLVKVDYRVYDWGVLVFDIEVPPGGTFRLPIGRIKGPGYSNPPRQPRPQEVARNIRKFYNWNGLEQTPADPRSTWAYVVAVDRQTGDILVDHEGAEWPANPYERRSRFLVNYRDGTLQFNFNPADASIYGYNPDVDTPDRTGRTYRIFCRAENDWAVQLMVAARQYARSANRFPGPTPMGFEEAAGGLTYAWNNDLPLQLYFPLSEAGQAVMVDYVAHDGSYITGEVHTIGPANVTDLGLWACRLAEPLQHTPYQILAVRGIGLRARALWVTTGRDYTLQELTRAIDAVGSLGRPDRPRPVVNEIWRQLTVSTYLTRAPI